MTRLLADLRIPVIAGPMTGVSTPEMLIACCRAGIIGTLPATNATSAFEFSEWVAMIDDSLGPDDAPYGINFPFKRSTDRYRQDLEVTLESRAQLLISSVGSPAPLMAPARAAGKLVYADVATMRHVERCVDIGVDGLIALSAGAGGFTGWLNPLAFVRSIRQRYSGPLILAGGVADGVALAAAITLGCDGAYLATALIPTEESGAPAEFQNAVLAASIDDVKLVEVSGLMANMVVIDRIDEASPSPTPGPFAMGHTAHLVQQRRRIADVVEEIRAEYLEARSSLG